jgi:hypothetical protein
MLFDYIIYWFPLSAMKRVYFRLARMLPRLAEVSGRASKIARGFRCAIARTLRSWPGSIARCGHLKEPIIFSGDHPAFIADRGFARP